MNKHDVHAWKIDTVTQHVIKLLKDAEDVIIDEMLGFGPGTGDFTDKFMYLKGKIDGIRLFLEAELEDSDEEDV